MTGGSVLLLERLPATAGHRDCRGADTPFEELATKGSDDAFEALVARYQTRVHRLVSGVLGPRFAADAEDATQEAFLQAYRRMSGFRGESRFETWLYRLAYNRAIDYRSRLIRIHPVASDKADPPTEPSSHANPYRSTLHNERARTLRRKIAGLSEPQRLAVHLRYWLGCSIDEIAKLTDSNPATVKSHLFRARRRLARMLEEPAT